jgi:lipoyl(octanoyl) transferase
MLLRLRNLGLRDYVDVWDRMREFTDTREREAADELWLTEHPPVFTLGRNGERAHILASGNIPIVQSDRGGQVTYHGPGQLVAYAMFDLQRRQMGPRGLVRHLEAAIIGTLSQYGIPAQARVDAPGVYVDGRKIASLGLRIRKGCSYHGISLNVDNDLEPFRQINPCGYKGLEVTSLETLGVRVTLAEAGVSLAARIMQEFGYTHIERWNHVPR